MRGAVMIGYSLKEIRIDSALCRKPVPAAEYIILVGTTGKSLDSDFIGKSTHIQINESPSGAA